MCVRARARTHVYEKDLMTQDMKKMNLILTAVLLCCGMSMLAGPLEGFRYEDASKFEIINKGWDNTSEAYTRLPQQ